MGASADKVFIDTSAWIAFLDASDRAHKGVARFFRDAVGKTALLTTDYVVHETLAYLNCSLKNHGLAAAFYAGCQNTAGLEIVAVPAETTEAALNEFFFKFTDQSISVVDAVSFYIMKRLGIDRALAVDNHFIMAGFQLIDIKRLSRPALTFNRFAARCACLVGSGRRYPRQQSRTTFTASGSVTAWPTETKTG